jgi:hypothetical protein
LPATERLPTALALLTLLSEVLDTRCEEIQRQKKERKDKKGKNGFWRAFSLFFSFFLFSPPPLLLSPRFCLGCATRTYVHSMRPNSRPWTALFRKEEEKKKGKRKKKKKKKKNRQYNRSMLLFPRHKGPRAWWWPK